MAIRVNEAPSSDARSQRLRRPLRTGVAGVGRSNSFNRRGGERPVGLRQLLGDMRKEGVVAPAGRGGTAVVFQWSSAASEASEPQRKQDEEYGQVRSSAAHETRWI
jgi:hypothetical protein